jgi:hypothetical protein
MVQPNLGAQKCTPVIRSTASAFTLEPLSVSAAHITHMVCFVALNALAVPAMSTASATLEVLVGTDEHAINVAAIHLNLTPVDAGPMHLCLELGVVTSSGLLAGTTLSNKPNHATSPVCHQNSMVRH